MSQGESLWPGWVQHVPIQTGGCVVKHQGFGWGLLERFNSSKRLVVAEIKRIEDNAVERVALVTKV
jgi:hypothetical protein